MKRPHLGWLAGQVVQSSQEARHND